MDETTPQSRFWLAPMEGYTDLPVRLWTAMASGFGAAVAPFLRVTADYAPKDIPADYAPEINRLKAAVPYELVPQIMAKTADDFCRVAEGFLREVPVVDLNLGCPSTTVVRHGGGSALLVDLVELEAMLETICRRLGPRRVSVKTRSGIESAERFEALLSILAEKPLARATIHPRTAVQAYNGEADWRLIDRAARTLPYPVIASGDVFSVADLRRMRGSVGGSCEVMVGRGAMRWPWLFEDLSSGVETSATSEALYHALPTLALLLVMAYDAPETWSQLAETDLVRVPCGRDPERWRERYARLSKIVLGHERSPRGLEIGVGPLRRLKQQWRAWQLVCEPLRGRSDILQATTFSRFWETMGDALSVTWE